MSNSPCYLGGGRLGGTSPAVGVVLQQQLAARYMPLQQQLAARVAQQMANRLDEPPRAARSIPH